MMKLDELDFRILSAILQNPRLSYRKIAKITGSTVPTVVDRIRSMERNRIIKRYSIKIDLRYLSEHKEIFLLINSKNTINDISEYTNVRRIIRLAGNKYLLFFIYEKTDVLEKFLDFLDSNDIKYVRFSVLDEIKDEDEFQILENMNLKLICDYCGSPITGEPITKKIGGEIKYFCCKTCANAYVERYKKLKSMLNQ